MAFESREQKFLPMGGKNFCTARPEQCELNYVQERMQPLLNSRVKGILNATWLRLEITFQQSRIAFQILPAWLN
jgi:hypothetical protein